MSEYYRNIDVVTQSRYLEKLKLLGLEEKDDPYDITTVVVCTLDPTVHALIESLLTP